MKKLIITLFAFALLSPFTTLAQGCMDAGDSDGVKVVGYIQPMYEYQFLDDGVSNLHGLRSPSSFFFERARIGVIGNIPYDFSYYVMTELSPSKGGPYILDAFVTYKRFDPWFNVSFGQFKGIFGLELSQGCQNLHTVYRSRVVSELASPFRTMGVMVFGGTGEKSFFGLESENLVQWKFSVTNGTGQNVYDNNLEKTYSARLVLNPTDWLSIGGSYSQGRHKSLKVGNPEDERTRMGADITLKKWDWMLQAEFIDGYDVGGSYVGGGCGSTPTYVTGDFWKQGYFAQLMYKTSFNLQPVVKYAMYDANIKLDDDMTTDFTFGLNYFFNESVRLQVNYVMTEEETTQVGNDFIVTQVQVKF